MQRTAEIGLDCNLFPHEVTFACQQGIFSPNLINSLDECLVFLSMVGLWYLCERFLDRWYLKRNLPYHKFPLQTLIIFFNNRNFPSKQNNSLTFLFPTIPYNNTNNTKKLSTQGNFPHQGSKGQFFIQCGCINKLLTWL